MRLPAWVSWRRINRTGGLIALALAVVLHFVLKEALAGSAAAASLLAPGGHVPLGALALVGGFVVVRLLVFLLLPGVLLLELGLWISGRIVAGDESATSEGPGP